MRDALRLRRAAAERLHASFSAVHASNGDDDRYEGRIASYTKTLPHDRFGEVDERAYEQLLKAIDSGCPAEFDAIPLAGVIKLANPQAALTFGLEGPDSHALPIAPAPRFDSAEQAAEACELYWQALLRDVPFSAFDSDPLVAEACAELNRLSAGRAWYGGHEITPGFLFRGPTHGDAAGPWLSQFLWKEAPYGAIRMVPHVRVATPGLDYLTRYDEWLAVQNGAATQPRHAGAYKYIRTGRDLAAYVQLDFTYQAFLTAALILFGMEGTTDVRRPYKGAPYDAANPYRQLRSQSGFVTFGVGHVLDLIPRVSQAALRAAWFHKWLVHRRLRPEEYGGRIHHHLSGTRKYPLHDSILESSAVHRVHSRRGTWLLPQAYPEGSPMHPAYPSGHAVIAGACATVMKAFFDESFPIEEPVIPTDDGLRLTPLKDATLTVGGELDKLASNIAFGRGIAGIHWRSDGMEGLRLGEAVALDMLAEMRPCFSEASGRFTLTRFDGSVTEV